MACMSGEASAPIGRIRKTPLNCIYLANNVAYIMGSVPARPISEGAAPSPNYYLNKINFVLLLQNVIAVFLFSDSRCKNACKMLADLCPRFHQSPTRPNFGRSLVKVCPT